jgi:hypothetical protein
VKRGSIDPQQRRGSRPVSLGKPQSSLDGQLLHVTQIHWLFIEAELFGGNPTLVKIRAQVAIGNSARNLECACGNALENAFEFTHVAGERVAQEQVEAGPGQDELMIEVSAQAIQEIPCQKWDIFWTPAEGRNFEYHFRHAGKKLRAKAIRLELRDRVAG